MDTKGTVEEVTIEAGHAYLDKLASGESIPAPDFETIATVRHFFDDHGISTTLIAVIDDTPETVEGISKQQKTGLAENYLAKWGVEPDSYHWESEAIDVWTKDWAPYQDLEYVKAEDSKWCDLTCAALDAAMTAEKLGLTDQTSIPGADLSVTQHDENYPIPSGEFSSFHGYDNQEESHKVQEQLHREGAIPAPIFQDSHNLEFNPEKVSNGELEQTLYQQVIE